MLTYEQIRAARAMLNLSQGDVAKNIGVKTMAISNLESEKTPIETAKSLTALKQFYEDCGLEFTEAGGVRPNDASIKTYKGDEGFRKFYDDIYAVVKNGGSIVIQNGLPDMLIKHLGKDFYDMHSKRMTKLSPNVKVLVRQNDTNLIGSSFATYRATKTEHFTDQTIYIYGDKTAFITFNEEVEVLLLDKPDITRAMRVSFNVIWEHAENLH